MASARTSWRDIVEGVIAKFAVPAQVAASAGDIAKVFLPQGAPQLATGESVGTCIVTSGFGPNGTRARLDSARPATLQPTFPAGKIIRGRVIETCRVEKSTEEHDTATHGADAILVMEVLGERVLAPGESWS